MKKWPNIYPQSGGYIVDCGVIDGKRSRKYHSTKAAAEKYAVKKREERNSGRFGALAITDQDLIDAVAAKKLLAGTGISFESLARKAIANGAVGGLTVKDLYDRYLAQKETAGLRKRSMNGIKAREGRFAEIFGHVPLHEITSETILKWVNNQNWNHVSRNTHLRGIRSLFNFAVKVGLIDRSPAIAIDYAKATLDRPTVFSVETVEKIMSWLQTNQPGQVPYYAIAFFAGIRPEETKRLVAENIDMTERLITVEPHSAKTHMRHVDIRENLQCWLEKYPVKKSVRWSRKSFRALVDSLSLDWGHDIARKSFISYHLAAFRSQDETAMQAGHRSTAMIYTVYRNIQTSDGQRITQDYANRYWEIFPKKKKMPNIPKPKPENPQRARARARV